MADPTDERAARSLRKAGERRIAHGALGTAHANLDEFVIVQGPRRLGDHGLGEAGIADQDDGFEGVGEATQISALFFGRFHGEILNLSGPCMAVRTPLNVAQSRTLRVPPGPIRQAFSALAG